MAVVSTLPHRVVHMKRVLVRERDEDDSENRRNGVSDIVPIDLPYVADHECSDNHKSAAGGPWGDTSEYGREEDGDEESEAGRHRRDTRLTALYTRRIDLA